MPRRRPTLRILREGVLLFFSLINHVAAPTTTTTSASASTATPPHPRTPPLPAPPHADVGANAHLLVVYAHAHYHLRFDTHLPAHAHIAHADVKRRVDAHARLRDWLHAHPRAIAYRAAAARSHSAGQKRPEGGSAKAGRARATATAGATVADTTGLYAPSFGVLVSRLPTGSAPELPGPGADSNERQGIAPCRSASSMPWRRRREVAYHGAIAQGGHQRTAVSMPCPPRPAHTPPRPSRAHPHPLRTPPRASPPRPRTPSPFPRTPSPFPRTRTRPPRTPTPSASVYAPTSTHALSAHTHTPSASAHALCIRARPSHPHKLRAHPRPFRTLALRTHPCPLRSHTLRTRARRASAHALPHLPSSIAPTERAAFFFLLSCI
ncbi:hypothetical protein PLICRDRAFT_169691 [Plicaturopsis crispa FD-325 SS-3]|nr:hypothetical protein PLICRDRAFT_169691 [Plicaturopsis crispa FD-325 SS-3]